MPETVFLAQHVQATPLRSLEDGGNKSVSEQHSKEQNGLPEGHRPLEVPNASIRENAPQQNMPEAIPFTDMPNLLTGLLYSDISQPSQREKEEFEQDHLLPEIRHYQSDPSSRSRLFARLGVRDRSRSFASSKDIDLLIASLCHLEVEKRIDTAYVVADMYEKVEEKQQMRARINLILMVWRDAEPYARIAAIKALSTIGTSDITEAIEIALRDDEKDVRAAAARALGKIGGQTSIVDLVSASRDEHWSVRASSLQAMGELKERAFLNTINAALDDEDPSVRIEALRALARIEGLQAAPHLVMIAQRDKQQQVRYAAIVELEMLTTSIGE